MKKTLIILLSAFISFCVLSKDIEIPNYYTSKIMLSSSCVLSEKIEDIAPLFTDFTAQTRLRNSDVSGSLDLNRLNLSHESLNAKLCVYITKEIDFKYSENSEKENIKYPSTESCKEVEVKENGGFSLRSMVAKNEGSEEEKAILGLKAYLEADLDLIISVRYKIKFDHYELDLDNCSFASLKRTPKAFKWALKKNQFSYVAFGLKLEASSESYDSLK